MIKSFASNLLSRCSGFLRRSNNQHPLISKNPSLVNYSNESNRPLISNITETVIKRYGSTWRYAGELNQHYGTAYPHKLKHITHHKHAKWIRIHTYGIQKQTRLRPVCNAQIGKDAISEGRPPKTIQVYSKVHSKKPHGAYGKLGDRVLMAVKGEVKKGIIVGMKNNQLHGIPRFDTNNVVFIDDSGAPIGNRINVPIPNCIKPILKRDSHPKKADYTKLFSIATKFV